MKHIPIEPVAIIGMGCVFPNAFNLEHYWKTLMSADSSAQMLPNPKRWDYRLFYSEDKKQPDKGYSALGGYVDGFRFNPADVNCSPEESITLMEQWLLTALKECILQIKSPLPEKGQLILGGTGVADYVNNLLLELEMVGDLKEKLDISPDVLQEIKKAVGTSEIAKPHSEFPLHVSAELAIKKLLPKTTTSLLVDAACASSLYSIDFGIKNLLQGKIDIAYCGGFFTMGPLGQVLFCKLNGLSAKGCFPFDERADGTLFGDGAGVIAIKRLSDALEAGDQIHAVIRGIGMSSDGKGKAVYAPNAAGQTLAIKRAYELTQVAPESIQYVEAHATGTPLGDSTEYSALASVFSNSHLDPESLPIGSVKGVFGHLGWAAGVASVIKIVLMLKHKKLPPQANFEKKHSNISSIKSPFRILREPQEWVENKNSDPRRAAVSGFGFGGTNAHLVIEEFTKDLQQSRSNKKTHTDRDSISIVALGAVFPGIPNAKEALERIGRNGSGNAITERRFNGSYPLNPIKYKMIAKAASVTDLSQFLLLDATEQALATILPHWKDFHIRTDVFVGHMNALSAYITHAKRIYWDSVKHYVKNISQEIAQEWETKIRDRIPLPSEDSFPGVMPNLLAGRLSNFFNLQGINVCVNSGLASFISALELGIQSLQFQQSDLALVGAVNFGVPKSYDDSKEQVPFGEGAVLFALMREEDRKAKGIPLVKILNDRVVDDLKKRSGPTRFGNLWCAQPAAALLESLVKVEKKDTFEDSLRLVASLTPAPLSAMPSGLSPALVPTYLGEKTSEGIFWLTNSEEQAEILRQQYPHARGTIIQQAKPDLLKAESIPEHLLIVIDLKPYISTKNNSELDDLWIYSYNIFREWYSDLCQKGTQCTQLLLNAWDKNGAPHSHIGLFAGMTRGLEVELSGGARLKTIVTDASDFLRAVPVLAPEASQKEAVAFYKEGKRFLRQLHLSNSGEKDRKSGIPLQSDSVVIAFGGARGITETIVQAVLSEVNCQMIVVGKTDLGSYDELFKISDERVQKGQKSLGIDDFIRFERRRDAMATVKKIKTEFERFNAAKKIRENLKKYQSQGKKVSYYHCDATDEIAVRKLFEDLIDKYKKIDWVIYGSGVSGPIARIDGIALSDVLPAKHVKVDGTIAVSNAALFYKPKLFITFSSIASNGIDGQVCYSAASDFQNTFCEAMNAAQKDCHYLCINWPGWDEVGMLADHDSLYQEIQKSKRLDLLKPTEGRLRFLDEVKSSSLPTSVFILAGQNDLKYYFEKRGYPLSWNFEKILDLSQDWYLKHHLVNGDPVLPGTFELDFAARAALIQNPEYKIFGFDRVILHRFVKVYSGKAAKLRIYCEQNRRSGSNRVQVQIYSDFISPKGIVLEKNRLHFEATVLLEKEMPKDVEKGELLSRFSGNETALLDPYHEKKSPVYLDDVFVTVVDRKCANSGVAKGIYRLESKVQGKVFEEFKVPSLLLDGALRLATCHTVHEHYIPMLVPLSIDKIRFYESANDIELAKTYGTLEAFSGQDSSCEVYDQKNQLILKVQGLKGHTMGYIDRRTSEYIKDLPHLPGPAIAPQNEFYVDKVLKQTSTEVILEREFSLERDPYLKTAAKLNGVSVLPGSFQIEIAVEAVRILRSGQNPTAIENLNFLKAFKLFPGKSARLRVHGKPKDGESDRYAITLLSDLVHQTTGKVLQRDVIHSTMEVIFEEKVERIDPLPWDANQNISKEPFIPEVLYWEISPLLLGHYFTSVWDTEVSGRLFRSVYRNQAELGPEIFGRHRVAPLLLDALLQNSLSRHGDYVSTGIPKKISRIRFCKFLNDYEIRSKYEHLFLLTEKDLAQASGKILQAVTPDGEVLYQAEGFESYGLGYIHTPTKTLHSILPATASNLVTEPATTEVISNLSMEATIPKSEISSEDVNEIAEVEVKDSVGRFERKWMETPLLSATESDLLRETSFDPKKDFFTVFDFREQVPDVVGYPELLKKLQVLFEKGQKWALPCRFGIACITPAGDQSHFAVGAVEGFLKSIQKEYSDFDYRLLITDVAEKSEILNLISDEFAASTADRVSYYSGHATSHSTRRRAVRRLVPRPISIDRPLVGDALFGADSVILITGGGRGISAEIAKALAEQTWCKLVLLGRTRFDSTIEAPPILAEFIRDSKKLHPGRATGQVLNLYRKWESEYELKNNLKEISSKGAVVEYRVCDITDRVQVCTTLNSIYEAHGKIDAVIHAAGIDHSTRLNRKSWEEFRSVFDVKVVGALHLLEFLRLRSLSAWYCFTSIHGIFGTPGQTDYCAANECLNDLTEHYQKQTQNSHPNITWKALNWPIWDDIGMGVKKPDLAQSLRSAGRSFLPAKEGVALFLNEFASKDRAAQIVFSTRKDLTTFGAKVFPLLDETYQISDHQFEGLRTFQLDRDPYLRYHLAGGTPSLAAAMELEMALELLAHSFPDLQVCEIANIELHRFIKVFKTRPMIVKARLEVLHNKDGFKSVRVSLLSDLVHSNGKTLEKDKLYWSAQFILSNKALPSNRIWRNPPKKGTARTPMAYQQDNRLVYYTHEMRSLDSLEMIDGVSVIGRVKVASGSSSIFSHFQIPFEIFDSIYLASSLDSESNGALTESTICMPFLTEEIKIYQELFTHRKDSVFWTRATPVRKMESGSIKSPIGGGVLECARLELFSKSGCLCLELKNTYLMVYSTSKSIKNANPWENPREQASEHAI